MRTASRLSGDIVKDNPLHSVSTNGQFVKRISFSSTEVLMNDNRAVFVQTSQNIDQSPLYLKVSITEIKKITLYIFFVFYFCSLDRMSVSLYSFGSLNRFLEPRFLAFHFQFYVNK